MYQEILGGYSQVGDVFLIALCFVCFLVAKTTFIKESKTTNIFKCDLLVLVIACLANIITCKLAIAESSAENIYIARDIYHGCLLVLFFLNEYYLIILMGIVENRPLYRHYIGISIFINVIGIVFDCLSPITHFGLYCDSMGYWHDSIWDKPYAICYAINMTYILYLLNKYRNAIIGKVRKIIILTSVISIVFVIVENIKGYNSYLALTYALPMLATLMLLHSNPYNVETGSFGNESFDDYLKTRSAHNKLDYFMCLRLYTDTSYVIPEKLGRVFYNFYEGYFDDATLFNPMAGCYVLAIKNEKNPDAITGINSLVSDVFQQYYKIYRIDYKILVFANNAFQSFASFFDIAAYFEKLNEINTATYLNESDLKKYQREKFILSQIQDINHIQDLNDKRVLAYCQPVKNIQLNCFDTAEALMRLDLPELGLISPNEFIPIAENNNLIHFLSMIILNKTCQELKRLNSSGKKIERISVNFSISEIGIPGFLDNFKQIVIGNNIPFEKIGVEFTETQNNVDIAAFSSVLNKLKTFGVCLYLDDFGTGYSNFDRILGLNFDVIKFDKSLVDLTDNNKDLETMIEHIAKAFSEIHCKILYEGIETKEQEERLAHVTADYMQGFYYSAPIPINKLDKFLT